MAKVSCFLAPALMLAGCADLQWHKAGASAQAMESDLADCRGQARLGTGPDTKLLRTDAGRLVGLTSSSISPAASGRLDGERFLAEHDLTRICMNRRGYELAPAEKR
jgi:hypothetical protein